MTPAQIPKLGMRSLGACEVQLDDVFVPDENIVGEVDNGWKLLAGTLNSERIIAAANRWSALGGILEDMISYASQRRAFGKPIRQFQEFQQITAGTHIGLETSRLHTYRAAWLHSQEAPCGVESTTAKIVASEACTTAADAGI